MVAKCAVKSKMPELTRTILGRLRNFIRDRRRAERLQVSLPFTISLVDERSSRRPQSTGGHTADVSTSGLALVLSVIRIGDHYLAGGENRRLRIKLELPVGPVDIQATSVRYESLDEENSETGYLIGVSITEMSEADRARYDEYVSSLLKRPK